MGEGSLWVGQYRDRKIYRTDPQTGAVLRTIESDRHVTGVTWVDGEFWHATMEDDESELWRIDSLTGAVLRYAAGNPHIGARIRWRGYVLLWRCGRREGKSGPQA
jgi:hypothetical protein